MVVFPWPVHEPRDNSFNVLCVTPFFDIFTEHADLNFPEFRFGADPKQSPFEGTSTRFRRLVRARGFVRSADRLLVSPAKAGFACGGRLRTRSFFSRFQTLGSISTKALVWRLSCMAVVHREKQNHRCDAKPKLTGDSPWRQQCESGHASSPCSQRNVGWLS